MTKAVSKQNSFRNTRIGDPNIFLAETLQPSTDATYKKTYRHFFKRRIGLKNQPLLVIMFQGVLGDFFKENGIS
jgi:hypothetical protein